jgi:RHS repeat-associated protein
MERHPPPWLLRELASYDGLSHLLSVLHQTGSTTLDGAGYTYDPAGNRTAKTNYLNGATSNYSYDPLYQLTQVAQGTSTTESYSYDPVGNRLSSSGVPSYSYNSSNELTSNSNGSYTYDANGNTLTDASGRPFTWDFENRLTQAVVPGTNGGTTTFRYDPFGRRIQKSGPLGTTNYLYDGDNSIQEIDQTGNLLARYTGEDEIDEPLAELRSGSVSYYEQDGQGSTSSLSSPSGALANTYTYDSFGKSTASTGTISNPLQYTAREFDPETQLYFNRARYRDPAAGQWLSEDPIRFLGGNDFYSYVVNNPLKYRDPLGWQSQMPSCYPDCVHTQEEIQEMQQEHDSTMQRILGPDWAPEKPGPQCNCHSSEYWEEVTAIYDHAQQKRIDLVKTTLGLSSGIYLSEQLLEALEVETPPGAIIKGLELVHLSYELWEIDHEANNEIAELRKSRGCQ